MPKINLPLRLGEYQEVFCPLSRNDELVFSKCQNDYNGDCLYYKGYAKTKDKFNKFHNCKNTQLFYCSFLEFSISKFNLAYCIPLPLHFSEE